MAGRPETAGAAINTGSKSRHRVSDGMFLSIATTYQPATDLGFLLNKHPDRVHELELTYDKVLVFYPEASETRCEAALENNEENGDTKNG